VAPLDVEQAAHDGIEEKNLAVARISQQLSDEWNVGLIATNGDPATNGNATLAGPISIFSAICRTRND
jgi:hypothetical protein